MSPVPLRERRARGARHNRRLALLGALTAAVLAMPMVGTAQAGDLPDGFFETSVIDGLNAPTAVAFAPDGDVFVTEQPGLLLRFDGLDDTTPTTVLDLTNDTNYFGDRGLLGLALDPEYAANKRAYIVYTYDAPRGETAPYYFDSCVRHCEVTARVERLDLSGPTAQRTVLINDWCGEYQSHSIGTLAFDPQGRLYVGGGDGADFNNPDYGQATPGGTATPWNECGDPPGPADTALDLPDSEGGALRSQDFRTSADPLGLSGTIIRIDPQTGNGVPGNPGYTTVGAAGTNEARLLAYGLRNPFRFAIAPNGRLWMGDAGWRTTEELDSFPTNSSTIPNFGWPCYEGAVRQSEYDAFDLDLCEGLYTDDGDGTRAVTDPAFTYDHHAPLYPDDPCPEPGGGSATSGITFYTGDTFPDEYDGSLFFTDYARYCIWNVPVDSGGQPIFSQMEVFDVLPEGNAAPVDLKVGPDGALYYVDIALGELRRIQHTIGNTPPVAVAETDPSTPPYGLIPLHVEFDATASTDADATDTLTYEWDLDGDGQFDDSTSATPSFDYNAPARTVTVRLRVSDGSPETDTDTIRVDVGNRPPVPQITTPGPGTTWTVGDQLTFHGMAADPDEGPLSPSSIRWDVDLNHCVTGGGCHVHHQSTVNGDDDLQFLAPDHYYPAYLTVTMRATDAKGLAVETKLDLMPNTVDVQAQSIPAGLQLQLNDVVGPAPQTITAIQGSQLQAIAPTPQTLSATAYKWCEWSDGGARVHFLTATAPVTLTATYAPNCPPTDLDLSSPSVAENAPAGTAIGTLSTTDPEAGDSHSYSFAEGTGDADNSSFEIDGSTLRTAEALDYEARSSYSVRVRTDDGHGGTVARDFTIDVTDTNDPPDGPRLSSEWVAENLPAGTTVAVIQSDDQDGGDTATFSLAEGEGDADNADFRVDGSTLETARRIDFEADRTRRVRLAVTDGAGARSERSFSIAVADLDEPVKLDVVKVKIPRRTSGLLKHGVRAQLRCSVDCSARVTLTAKGHVAREIGLESPVGRARKQLDAREKVWVTTELDHRSERLLTDYDGKRAPKIEPDFEASGR